MIYIFSWFLSVSKLETGLEWFKSSSLKSRPETMAVRFPQTVLARTRLDEAQGWFSKTRQGIRPTLNRF
jgi:hypothetical protein